jgi:hypothetical protein
MTSDGDGQGGANQPPELIELQRDLRSAAGIAYALRRHEQILQHAWIADALAELEAALLDLERKLGGPRRAEAVATALPPLRERLAGVAHDAGPIVAAQIGALMGSVRALELQLSTAT